VGEATTETLNWAAAGAHEDVDGLAALGHEDAPEPVVLGRLCPVGIHQKNGPVAATRRQKCPRYSIWASF